jgi:zinc/manganese transport system substrate-binding protein
MDNPNTDPHAFEASPGVAGTVGSASLVVQNGLGYDDFMSKIEAASPSSRRRVIDVQRLLGLPSSTPNPHLWYRPGTMPVVARALARDLAALLPRHAAYFRANATRFVRSLSPWYAALHRFGRRFPGAAVATTEPVADFMLQAAGAHNVTPFSFQADVMNGVDPAAQSVSTLQGELVRGRVRAFVYNVQVTDSLTESLRARARSAGIPVVGVYETLPSGYDYQRWMLAEVQALERAVADGVSTERL